MTDPLSASIRGRLLNQAKAKGEEFERTLTRFAAERLLYRIGASGARDRCILKGASLLSVWLPDPYRATRDVDVLAFGAADDEAIRSLVTEICAARCPEDALSFDLLNLTIEPIRPEDEYSGKRARFRAQLGSARIAVQLDIGFGDAIGGQLEEVVYPTMLPALPAPRLRAYPREIAVAEKFEAMVNLDTRNSRMKDFHDVWALANAFDFAGASLQKAIATCFERRATRLDNETPRVLTAAFYQMREIEQRWRRYLAAGAILISPPTQFEVIGDRIGQFLGPVRESIVAGRQFASVWLAGGPWRAT
jgi:hypothetical protein